LQIYNDWEDTCRSVALSSISGKAMRQIKCVEVPLNVQLFHIDIDFDVSQKLPRLRQIVDDPGELVAMLDVYAERLIRVSMQSSGDKNGEYTIVFLHQIRLTRNIDGTIKYLFTDKDGVIYVDSLSNGGSSTQGKIDVLWEYKDYS
jgi:hypothetical protein